MAKRKKLNTKQFIAVIGASILILSSVLITVSEKYGDILGIPTWNDIFITAGLKKAPLSNADMSVHFIDVLQGDSELIICGGQTLLIDAGDNTMGETVVDYIKRQGIYKIDYVIATHPHADHIGGLDDVINSFEVSNIIMSKIPDSIVPTTKTYMNLLEAIDKKNVNVIKATAGYEFNIGDAKVTVIAPVKDYDDLNNMSVVARVEYNSRSLLFMGDAEKESETDILESGIDISADVIKIGHHGSSTSSTEKFLKKVNPKYCVVSVKADNDYNLPSKKVIERINSLSITCYRTDINGNVIMECSNEDISFKTEK